MKYQKNFSHQKTEGKMKLQLALDDMPLQEAISFTKKVEKYIDVIEIGTPFIIDEGVNAVREFKKEFPAKEILADLKIMDAGAYEAELALKAGADYVTDLGVTDVLTVKGCVEMADKYNKEIVVDMICVSDLPAKIKEMEDVKAHFVSVHTGADQQAAGREPIEDLKIMTAHTKKAKISVAGGISSRTAQMYVDLNPDILIVGSAITHADDPAAEAKAIRDIMDGGKK